MDRVCEDNGFKVGVVKKESIEIEILKKRVNMIGPWGRWRWEVMGLGG